MFIPLSPTRRAMKVRAIMSAKKAMEKTHRGTASGIKAFAVIHHGIMNE
jgi:hypothetical protein